MIDVSVRTADGHAAERRRHERKHGDARAFGRLVSRRREGDAGDADAEGDEAGGAEPDEETEAPELARAVAVEVVARGASDALVAALHVERLARRARVDPEPDRRADEREAEPSGHP